MSETCSIDLNMATLEDEGVLFEQKQEFLSQIEEVIFSNNIFDGF